MKIAAYQKIIGHSMVKYWDIIKKVPWLVARYAFFVTVLLVVIEILLGQLLFYRYAFLAKNIQGDTPSATTFNEPAYQSILGALEQRSNVLRDFSPQEYRDPFK